MSTDAITRRGSKVGTRYMVQIGMLGAVAVVLMLFDIPLWFAPIFYKIDLSEVPVLVGAFAMGPVAGILIELVKILVNFIINGTDTAGVGELANFLIGCSLIVPASLIYKHHKSRITALIGLGVGILIMAIVGSLLNAYVLLPAYSLAFHMPIEALVGMGTAINSSITSLSTFVIFVVAPFNILKGLIVSVVTLLLYRRISPILHQR